MREMDGWTDGALTRARMRGKFEFPNRGEVFVPSGEGEDVLRKVCYLRLGAQLMTLCIQQSCLFEFEFAFVLDTSSLVLAMPSLPQSI